MTEVIHEIPEVQAIPGLTIRYTVPQDAEWLRKWLLDPSVRDAFPMASEVEVDDAVRRWISFSRIRSSLTVEMEGSISKRTDASLIKQNLALSSLQNTETEKSGRFSSIQSSNLPNSTSTSN